MYHAGPEGNTWRYDAFQTHLRCRRRKGALYLVRGYIAMSLRAPRTTVNPSNRRHDTTQAYFEVRRRY